MRFILIGNFPPDKQESMNRFAQMLYNGFLNAGFETEIWNPKSVLSGGAKSTLQGLGKWLGYIDKWLLFPILLRWRLLSKSLKKGDVYFHICDHSNAPYLKHLPIDRTGITCHDVLAIRGAMGFEDAYCPATSTGKILQQWILTNLAHARRLAADSQTTLTQLIELVSDAPYPEKDWRRIHIGFNNDFTPIDKRKKEILIEAVGLTSQENFLLCVGSGLPRKNRRLVIDMVSYLGDKWQGRICFAGQEADNYLLAYADSLGLKDRIISVTKPDHDTLVALYGACEALVFPSFSEGFGWPIIEAQACGAPVIASSLNPMPEVSGGAALHADPYQPKAFADAFQQLQNKELRVDLIQRGFINCQRFESTLMIDTYLSLYGVKTETQ